MSNLQTQNIHTHMYIYGRTFTSPRSPPPLALVAPTRTSIRRANAYCPIGANDGSDRQAGAADGTCACRGAAPDRGSEQWGIQDSAPLCDE